MCTLFVGINNDGWASIIGRVFVATASLDVMVIFLLHLVPFDFDFHFADVKKPGSFESGFLQFEVGALHVGCLLPQR